MQFAMKKTNTCLKLILLLMVVLPLTQACKNKAVENVITTDAAVKSSENIIGIKRYERALFALNKDKLRQGMATLYPEFAFFMGNNWADTMNVLRIYNFLNDPNVRELYEITEKKYPDVEFLEKGLNDAFKLYLEAYPGKKVPQVFTYVSGLDIENPVYYFDTAMAIGLDLFLGSDVQAYLKAGIPKYKINNFTVDHILPQCMLSVSDYVVRVDEQKNTLLDEMIIAGKALYFLDVTLPDVKDEFKIGYTSEQLAWSEKNQSNIWAFIIENQLLFSSDSQGITKLITDAPNTMGFDAKSPGRLGAYIGWLIVRTYIGQMGDIPLKECMENVDAQEILKVSGYKPGKN